MIVTKKRGLELGKRLARLRDELERQDRIVDEMFRTMGLESSEAPASLNPQPRGIRG